MFIIQLIKMFFDVSKIRKTYALTLEIKKAEYQKNTFESSLHFKIELNSLRYLLSLF